MRGMFDDAAMLLGISHGVMALAGVFVGWLIWG